MIKLIQAVVDWYYSWVYPPSKIDPVQREWMRRRAELPRR
jgi:hypothetical protein